MNFPEVVFIASKELPGGELLLYTRPPFHLARVFRFDSGRAMEEFAIKHNVLLDCENVPGYNMLICYAGTIDKASEKLVLGHNVPAEAKPFLKQVLKVYESERIKGNESRLKRFARP